MTPEQPSPAEPPGRVFVGRKPELGALHAGLDRAMAGHGGVFLVAGEPGSARASWRTGWAAKPRAAGRRCSGAARGREKALLPTGPGRRSSALTWKPARSRTLRLSS